MPYARKIDTDLVIIGGGMMGTVIAHQAALAGIRSVTLEKNKIKGPHYSTHIWAPRADYMLEDIDEVRRTDYECKRWLDILPEAFKPQLFIIPINDKVPHSFENFRVLLNLYDRVSKERIKLLPRPSFEINEATLKKTEPNLKDGCFDKAIGFYELTSDPKQIVSLLRLRVKSLNQENLVLDTERIITYLRTGDAIDGILLSTEQGEVLRLSNSSGRLVIINSAGPWINQVAKDVGIVFPLEFYIGIQATIPQKYCFQSNLIIFADDGKYLIVKPEKDHTQIGPTNVHYEGTPEDFISDRERVKDQLSYLEKAWQGIVEPECKVQGISLKSIGARLKLKLPCNSNRSFIFTDNEAGLSNYLAVYPGKLPSSLKTADELLKILAERGLVPCKAKYFLGSRGGVLIGQKKVYNLILLSLEKIKSVLIVGAYMLINKFKNP